MRSRYINFRKSRNNEGIINQITLEWVHEHIVTKVGLCFDLLHDIMDDAIRNTPTPCLLDVSWWRHNRLHITSQLRWRRAETVSFIVIIVNDSVDNVWFCCFLYCYSLPRPLLNLSHCHWFCVNSPPISPYIWCYSCQYAICSHCRFLTICDVIFFFIKISWLQGFRKSFYNDVCQFSMNWYCVRNERVWCGLLFVSHRTNTDIWSYTMPSLINKILQAYV